MPCEQSVIVRLFILEKLKGSCICSYGAQGSKVKNVEVSGLQRVHKEGPSSKGAPERSKVMDLAINDLQRVQSDGSSDQ